jgi:hypothetical protein
MKVLFKKKWFILLVSFILSIGLIVGMAVPAMAATTAVVTVTNTTQFISITNNLGTYNFNAAGAAHAGVLVNTTYYSNPGGQTTAPSATVVDGECAFDVTDASSVSVDIVINSSNMATGSDNSTNGNTGTQGTTTYGAYTYVSGLLLSAKVLCKSSASDTAISTLGATANKYWGFQINEQTNAWTGATPATFTITLTASAH